MKITATKQITIDFQPAKIARSYVNQLKEIGKKYVPEASLSELFEERTEPSIGDFDGYIENEIDRQLPEGYTYDYDECIKLQRAVEKKILELIEKEESK